MPRCEAGAPDAFLARRVSLTGVASGHMAPVGAGRRAVNYVATAGQAMLPRSNCGQLRCLKQVNANQMEKPAFPHHGYAFRSVSSMQASRQRRLSPPQKLPVQPCKRSVEVPAGVPSVFREAVDPSLVMTRLAEKNLCLERHCPGRSQSNLSHQSLTPRTGPPRRQVFCQPPRRPASATSFESLQNPRSKLRHYAWVHRQESPLPHQTRSQPSHTQQELQPQSMRSCTSLGSLASTISLTPPSTMGSLPSTIAHSQGTTEIVSHHSETISMECQPVPSRKPNHGPVSARYGSEGWLAAARRVTTDDDIPTPGVLALQSINQEEAVRICSCQNINELSRLPTYAHEPDTLGTWMIWMVHRVALNDPNLTRLNFNNFTMPSWIEKKHRIAPKLIGSLEKNTHLTELHLANTNLGGCGAELGKALKNNTTLRILNIESNALSSNDLELIFKALEMNKTLQELRCEGQFGSGDLGRSVFEAVNHMLEKNNMLQKLGMYLTDPHVRSSINLKLVNNTDDNCRRVRMTRKMFEGINERLGPGRSLWEEIRPFYDAVSRQAECMVMEDDKSG